MLLRENKVLSTLSFVFHSCKHRSDVVSLYEGIYQLRSRIRERKMFVSKTLSARWLLKANCTLSDVSSWKIWEQGLTEKLGSLSSHKSSSLWSVCLNMSSTDWFSIMRRSKDSLKWQWADIASQGLLPLVSREVRRLAIQELWNTWVKHPRSYCCSAFLLIKVSLVTPRRNAIDNFSWTNTTLTQSFLY